jgi:hypothetical protein
METFEGGCHCGAVRFRVRLEKRVALDCNCSICAKKGYLHAIVPPDRFECLAGAEGLAEYRFGTKTARHLFCKTCGVAPFYEPRSHPGWVDVNVRCLDGDEWRTFAIEPFDGRNWEANVEQIRSI